MSYCVNCGVELERSTQNCPLCGVIVINPADLEPAEKLNTFPENRDEQKPNNRSFWIKFNLILAVVPIATCLLLNLFHDKQLSWSIFVAAGIFMLWAICTSPFFFKQFTYKKMLFADFIAVVIGLGLIACPLPVSSWFLHVAIPLVIYCFLSWLLILFLIKKKLVSGLGIAASFSVSVALMIILLEILLDLYLTGRVELIWSWFVTAPCLAIAAQLILLDRNVQVRQELAKRLHF